MITNRDAHSVGLGLSGPIGDRNGCVIFQRLHTGAEDHERYADVRGAIFLLHELRCIQCRHQAFHAVFADLNQDLVLELLCRLRAKG